MIQLGISGDECETVGGEPATVIAAPAIANAIFAATGARVRQGPFTPERIKTALSEREVKKWKNSF